MSLPRPPLLLITDRQQAAHHVPDIVAAALDAGCRWVSVREKDLPEHELQALVERIRPLAGAAGARLGVHGTAELAMRLGVDAVHLPSGGDAAGARRLMGPGALIGLSIHALSEAASLDPAHLDYAILGPAFATASKPGYGPALGTEGISAAVSASAVPLMAVGGIEAGNALSVLAAGAAGVAVMGGVMRAGEPGRTVRELLTALA